MQRAIVSLGCLALLTSLLIVGCGGSAARPMPTPQPVAQAPTATAPAGPTQTPAPTPTLTPYVVYVGNTDGLGVALRKEAGGTERIKAWPDRTAMTVVGEDQLVEGGLWAPVRDPDGNMGWVSRAYLLLPTPTPAPTATPDRSRYKLELLAATGTRSYGFAKVEGQLKNISGQSLKNVTAVVEWYTEDGQFVKSDTALIEYNPILSGQTSPFTVMGTDNPAMKKYSVSFKELLGGTLPTLDSRKR